MRRNFSLIGARISAGAAAVGIAILAMLFSEPAWPAAGRAGQTRERPNRSAINLLVKPGEYPPDFNLPRLTLTTDAEGTSVGVINEKDRIRLSSFRGKRPVCLIMSSYT